MNSKVSVQQQSQVNAATLEWSDLPLSDLSLKASPALDQLVLLSSTKTSEATSSDLAESPEPVTPLPLDHQVSTAAADLVGTPDVLTPVNILHLSLPAAELAQADDATPEAETAQASGGGSGLAQQAQNPIANLISVPFQFNANFNVGPFDQTQYLLNIQPVVPVALSDDLLLVSRFIIPVISQPTVEISSTGQLEPGSSEFGLGDINPSFFFVPQTGSNITWGVGPAFLLPTATNEVLGTDRWSAGPTGVVVITNGPWLYGLLVGQLWSFAGNEDRPEVSLFSAQPFLNYSFPGGWTIGSAPVITSNWNAAEEEDKWTVPVGLTVSKLTVFGRQPVQFTLGGFYNVVRPNAAADWTLRFATTLLFPTGGQ